MSMGMPCESSYYESHPKTSTDRIPEQETAAMTNPTATYAQAVLDNAAGRTSSEDEDRFLDGMLQDFRADALLSASRTAGIDRKFWQLVADKLAA